MEIGARHFHPLGVTGLIAKLAPTLGTTAEIFGQSSTYGPHANFKISLRELPDHGNFRVTITAARFDDALLLDDKLVSAEATAAATHSIEYSSNSAPIEFELAESGVYQVDLVFEPASEKQAGKDKQQLEYTQLRIGERSFANRLAIEKSAEAGSRRKAFMLIRLPSGKSTPPAGAPLS